VKRLKVAGCIVYKWATMHAQCKLRRERSISVRSDMHRIRLRHIILQDHQSTEHADIYSGLPIVVNCRGRDYITASHCRSDAVLATGDGPAPAGIEIRDDAHVFTEWRKSRQRRNLTSTSHA